MVIMKNGLYLDFKWDDENDIPLLLISDSPNINAGGIWFNLKIYSFEQALEEAKRTLTAKPENETY